MGAYRRWITVVVLAAALSGCALTDVHLKPPTTGLKTPIPGGSQRQVVVVAPFADERAIKHRCGMQKGGYGNETASAFCQGEPAQWLADLLARELAASGFTVLPAEAGARDSALKLEGVVLKLFTEPVVGAWITSVESDLNVKLVATSRTGLRAERTFFVKGELDSPIWTQGIFNDSLEAGMRELLAKMVGAILELMQRYPELGLAPGGPGGPAVARAEGGR
jgi:hypothetical protein